jgi:hypothetical protein
MKGYIEYLELFGYFARAGEPKLTQEEYVRADGVYKALAAKHPNLDATERQDLADYKALLFRDKP